MPYILHSEEGVTGREDYDKEIDAIIYKLHWGNHWNPGDVNYVIYRILLGWWKHERRYHTICNIMGTLSSVTQEFYRKIAAPYEDQAENKNGPIT